MTKIFALLVAFVCSGFSAFAAGPPTPAPGISIERLAKVYGYLKVCEQMLAGAITTSADDLKAKALTMPIDEVKKECSESVERCIVKLAAPGREYRSDLFATMKNAYLRLVFDREEDYQGHLWYAGKSPGPALNETRKYAAAIRDRLKKF